MAYAMVRSMRQTAALDALESSLGELLAVAVDAGWASLTTLASLSYQTGHGADALAGWVHQYNHHRPHSALGGQPPITRSDNLGGHHT